VARKYAIYNITFLFAHAQNKAVGARKQLFVHVLDRATPAIVADPIANLLASPNLQLVQDPRDPRDPRLLPNF